MSSLSTAKMTSKQFLLLGEDPPGVHLELAHGEIVVSPSPSPKHSRVIVKLVRIIEPYLENEDLGELFLDTDTVFDDENTRRPDMIFFSKGRLHLVGEQALLGPPDLCVEVLSPSNRKMDLDDKFALYEKRGVANYWIIDPVGRSLEAYVLREQKYSRAVTGREADIVHLPPFPELAIALAKLWPKQ
jgi:Uma2 family endonuclease